jgi:hypothetical protein
MATQYTSVLKLALPTTGELSGTWGDVVNDNITSMVEQAIAGLATINTWTTNTHTLTVANGTTSESRCAMLVAQDGAGLTAAGEIICPAATKLYVLKNSTTYAITLKTASGTGVAVPVGQTAFLFCDGTNVAACVTTLVDASVTGNLTVSGNTTLGDANTDTITTNARFNTDLLPSTDNARDLGSSANSWRNLWIDGTATMALATISGGTINNTVIGGVTPAAATFTTLTSNSTTTLNGTTIPASVTLVSTAATQTLTNKTLTSPAISSIVNTGTLTLPTATDTLVARGTTDTLTNKTISGANNTLSNIGNGSLTNSSLTIGSTNIVLGGTAASLAGLTGVTATTFTGALSGNATTATTLQTARTIGGVSFNGSANIDLPGVNTAGNQNTTGSAASLTTARAINGTNFNGTAAITTANWGTARTIWGQSINGSANITAPVLPAAGSVTAPAFSTSGDTNTGIFFPAADAVGLSTNGTERVRINSAGNVFVGNGETAAAPTAAIISATGGVGTNISGANLTIRSGANTGSGTGSELNFSTSPSGASGTAVRNAISHMRITRAGNVRIGDGEFSGGVGATEPILRVSNSSMFTATNTANYNLLTLANSFSGSAVPFGLEFHALWFDEFTFQSFPNNSFIRSTSVTGLSPGTVLTFGTTDLNGTLAERVRIAYNPVNVNAGVVANVCALTVQGQIAGGYQNVGTNTVAQNLAVNRVSEVVVSANVSLTTNVPPAGATAYVIIQTSGTTSRTVTFSTGFASTGTLATGTVSARRFVVSFVSDGTRLIETSRTVAIAV